MIGSTDGHISDDDSRFVLLHHRTTDVFLAETGRGDHFDLMLECPGQELLVSWAFELNPFAEMDSETAHSGSCQVFHGQKVPGHRKDYLTYEGPVSRNRGEVRRLIAGTCVWKEQSRDHSVVSLFWEQWHCEATIESRGDDQVQLTLVVI